MLSDESRCPSLACSSERGHSWHNCFRLRFGPGETRASTSSASAKRLLKQPRNAGLARTQHRRFHGGFVIALEGQSPRLSAPSWGISFQTEATHHAPFATLASALLPVQFDPRWGLVQYWGDKYVVAMLAKICQVSGRPSTPRSALRSFHPAGRASLIASRHGTKQSWVGDPM